jgi:4'-phosphopantetheinyl transferase
MGAGASALFFDDAAIEVSVTCLDVAPDVVEAASALLSDDERERAGRFVHLRDRHRYTVARAWLRQLLGARMHVPPRLVAFIYGHYGKPALAPAFSGSALCFNVSHAGNLAVCALASGREIGIDVEAVRAMRDADSIAARLFSPRENRAYRALDPRDRTLGFFNCWTRKEAFVKALGDGLGHALDSFDVSLAPAEPAQLLRIGNTSGRCSGWRLHTFSPAAGHIGAIAVRQSAGETTSAASPGWCGCPLLGNVHA